MNHPSPPVVVVAIAAEAHPRPRVAAGRRPDAMVRCRGDEGSAYAFVIVFPLAILIFMTLVQWGLYYHAQALANAAAQDGLRASQTRTGNDAEGQAVARATLGNATTGGLLEHVTVNVSTTGGQVQAFVSGDVAQLVPFPLPHTIRANASGPKEQFVNAPTP